MVRAVRKLMLGLSLLSIGGVAAAADPLPLTSVLPRMFDAPASPVGVCAFQSPYLNVVRSIGQGWYVPTVILKSPSTCPVENGLGVVSVALPIASLPAAPLAHVELSFWNPQTTVFTTRVRVSFGIIDDNGLTVCSGSNNSFGTPVTFQPLQTVRWKYDAAGWNCASAPPYTGKGTLVVSIWRVTGGGEGDQDLQFIHGSVSLK
jgi:hypothetical protein